ncbi:MAG: hypothetical protein P1P88_09135 [Bacteroidales bacterium]|nr:hypothetical protein [Bacteroidales bacterium]
MEMSELLIKLADNELSPEERENLEKELYKNPKLMQEYLDYLEMNEFLDGKFATKDINKENEPENKLNENAGKKSLEAEKEAYSKGTFFSSVDLVKEIREKRHKNDYPDDLKKFVSLGLERKANENRKKSQGTVKHIGRKINLLNKWFLIAASIVVLVSISVVLKKTVFVRVNSSELFATYYQPYFFVVDQTRSSDSLSDVLVNEATELYKAGDYELASNISANVLEIDNKQVKALFIHGLTMIEVKNYQKAADEFGIILTNYDSFQLESKWYLALCFLKLERKRDAKKLLRELSLSKNYYQMRAVAMLEVMGG